MKKKIITTVLFVAAAGGTWLATRAGMAQAFRPVPVVVKYKTSTYKAGETQPVYVRQRELAIRSDGTSIETELFQSIMDKKEYIRATIVDAANRQRIVTEPITESLTTYKISDRQLKSIQNPGAQCSSLVSPVAGHFLGVETLTTVDTTMPKRIIEKTYSPTLGCVILRQVVRELDDLGNANVVTLDEAVSYELTELPANAFRAPAWRERSPSAVSAEYQRKFGLSVHTPDFNELWAAKDKAYRQQQ